MDVLLLVEGHVFGQHEFKYRHEFIHLISLDIKRGNGQFLNGGKNKFHECQIVDNFNFNANLQIF